MQNTEDNLLKQAEELEKRSKVEIRNKNYDSAIALLLEAKDLYARLALTGQVGILLKEIVKIKNIKKEDMKLETVSVDRLQVQKEDAIKMEVNGKESLETKGNNLLEEARKLTLNEELDKALKLYNEAYDSFKKINYSYVMKQILWQINEIKKYQKWNRSQSSTKQQIPVKDILALAAAEKRRLRIQEELSEGKKSRTKHEIEERSRAVDLKEVKSYKLFEQLSEKEHLEKEQKKAEKELLQKQREERNQVIKERTMKLRHLTERKKKEESLLKTAEESLNIAKSLVQKRQYGQAKSHYEKAIETFTQLGWLDQVRVLKQELWNIDRYKKEYEKKLELEITAKQKSEDEFEKRVKLVSHKQEKHQEIALEKMKALSPELKAKLEKICLIKRKADKEESLNNFSRILDRYKYILELYNSIPTDILDVNEEISQIRKKISELESRL
ncbi:MAG: hypothetical protein ACFFBH_08435 [Promethearchaeota archaeon]